VVSCNFDHNYIIIVDGTYIMVLIPRSERRVKMEIGILVLIVYATNLFKISSDKSKIKNGDLI
jgi:hypothetical protein